MFFCLVFNSRLACLQVWLKPKVSFGVIRGIVSGFKAGIKDHTTMSWLNLVTTAVGIYDISCVGIKTKLIGESSLNLRVPDLFSPKYFLSHLQLQNVFLEFQEPLLKESLLPSAIHFYINHHDHFHRYTNSVYIINLFMNSLNIYWAKAVPGNVLDTGAVVTTTTDPASALVEFTISQGKENWPRYCNFW